jgi:hypothetical protein
MWLNFREIDVMYIYWPVILIGLTMIILFLPFRLLYHRARKWWAFSIVSSPFYCQLSLTSCSGVCLLRDYTLLSSATFSWETCIPLRHMPWA